MVLIITATFLSPAKAGVLWYNGDYDNRDSLTNESKVPINTGSGYVLQTSLVYDNFIVPVGQTWVISSVYSNDQMSYYAAATTATWQIRTNTVNGVGGQLIAGGDTAATQVALSPVGGNYYGDPEYRVTATVPSIALNAGSYWLAVAPDSAGYYGDQSYIETTSGANSVGTPQGNDGNSYISNTYPTTGSAHYNYTATTTALAGDGDGPLIDFSMGVIGTTVVPEPSSVILVALGLIGSVGSLARSQRRRAALAAR